MHNCDIHPILKPYWVTNNGMNGGFCSSLFDGKFSKFQGWVFNFSAPYSFFSLCYETRTSSFARELPSNVVCLEFSFFLVCLTDFCGFRLLIRENIADLASNAKMRMRNREIVSGRIFGLRKKRELVGATETLTTARNWIKAYSMHACQWKS